MYIVINFLTNDLMICVHILHTSNINHDCNFFSDEANYGDFLAPHFIPYSGGGEN